MYSQFSSSGVFPQVPQAQYEPRQYREVQLPSFSPGEGMNLVNERGQTILGVGQFGQPEANYAGSIDENKKARASAFIFVPSQKAVIYFNNETRHPNDSEESRHHKIWNAILKSISFNIPTSGAYFICLDNPPTAESRMNRANYHNDSSQYNFLPETIGQLFRSSLITHLTMNEPKPANYTCIEYRHECVSTTIKNPLDPNDVIRFWACPGTVLCAENANQQHSTPYQAQSIDGYPVRDLGNSYIAETQALGREIYRTRYTDISEQSFGVLMGAIQSGILVDGRDYDMINLGSGLDPLLQVPMFPQMLMSQYLSQSRYQEAGMKRIKHKKTKKHRKKSS